MRKNICPNAIYVYVPVVNHKLPREDGNRVIWALIKCSRVQVIYSTILESYVTYFSFKL